MENTKKHNILFWGTQSITEKIKFTHTHTHTHTRTKYRTLPVNVQVAPREGKDLYSHQFQLGLFDLKALLSF